MRRMVSVAAKSNFTFTLKHIIGVDNSIADTLSRFQAKRFRALAPDANPIFEEVPYIFPLLKTALFPTNSSIEVWRRWGQPIFQRLRGSLINQLWKSFEIFVKIILFVAFPHQKPPHYAFDSIGLRMVTFSTVKVNLAAISDAHAERNFKNPVSCIRVNWALSSYKRLAGVSRDWWHATCVTQGRIFSSRMSDCNKLLFWSSFTAGFFRAAYGRWVEEKKTRLTLLKFYDISFRDKVANITLGSSETDQLHQG